MRKVMVSAALAACIMAPAALADSLDQAFEPAAMFKLDFGGAGRAEAGFALRLNYSSAVRQSLARLAQVPDTAAQTAEVRGRSNLFSGPSLGQLDFNRHGFHRVSLVGLPLVTRYVRTQDAAADGSAAETAADASAEAAAAEDASWYDYSSWGWKGWTLAGAGAVGIYLLASDDDDEDSAPAGGGGDEPPAEEECLTFSDPITGECIF